MTALYTVRQGLGLFDGTFPNKSMGFGDENIDKEPEHIQWIRREYRNVTVFTDMCLNDEVDLAPVGTRKIAWLIEPAGFSTTSYNKVIDRIDDFHYVISHDKHFLNTWIPLSKGFWCPCGGAWISLHSYDEDKSGGISFITTAKSRTEGHLLRQSIFQRIRDDRLNVDCFGAGATSLLHKSLALKPYDFSIVVESVKTPGYFSEKLIDCMLSKTMPIYWGAPDINQYFNPDGMVFFNSLDHLSVILSSRWEWDRDNYVQHYDAIEENYKLAQQYFCPEDWAFAHYPWLFR